MSLANEEYTAETGHISGEITIFQPGTFLEIGIYVYEDVSGLRFATVNLFVFKERLLERHRLI
jgi:hypothetical protein